jgi:5-methylcytosine-specific restriction endonuclease McrA
VPIRPEFRKYYRADWRRLRLALIAKAGNVCEACKRPHVMLNLTHLSGDPEDRRNLAVLCPSCHSRRDIGQKVAVARRTRAYRKGQLWLSDELELAHLPARLLPFELRQMRLF